MIYKDRNGKTIKAGDLLRHPDGTTIIFHEDDAVLRFPKAGFSAHLRLNEWEVVDDLDFKFTCGIQDRAKGCEFCE